MIPQVAASGDTDLMINNNKIYVSKTELSNEEEVTIYALIENKGEAARAQVRFFYAGTLELIGEDEITVDMEASAFAMTTFQPPLGSCDILVRIEDVSPEDNNLKNNKATAAWEFITGNVDLKMEHAEATIEEGIERVIPIAVMTNSDLADVTISVIHQGTVDFELLTPPQDIAAFNVVTFYVRVKVPKLANDMIMTNKTLLIQATSGEHKSNIVELRLKIHPSVESSTWWSPTVAVAAGTFGLFAAMGSTEVGKYKLISFVGPLYTKLSREEILDHYTRGKIHGYILANPGEHYNMIRKALEISNGSFAYHLRVLEREGLIKSKRDGMYKRFYPKDARISQDQDKPHINGTQKIIIEKIRDTPGITQKEIALFLGVNRSTINYHINKLSQVGIVYTERWGMSVRYFINPTNEHNDYVEFIQLPSLQ
jgi:DNA-binding MarR family transcriptional regulator